MNEIKIYLKRSGSLAEFYRDFSVYEGGFRTIQISIYVPKNLLPADDGITHAVKTGAILTAPNGAKTTTKAYYANYQEDVTIAGTPYSVYTQVMPQEYTQFAGKQRIVVNVVNISSDGDTQEIESIVTSQVVPLVVLESARLEGDGEEDPMDPSQAEIIEGQLNDLSERVSANEGDIDQLQIDVADMQDAKGAFEAYIGKQIQFVRSVGDVTQEGFLYGIVADKGANLFDLCVYQNGEAMKIGSANLVVNGTKYYMGVLKPGLWENGAQTVSLDGVTADGTVTSSPIDEDAAAFVLNGIEAASYGDGYVSYSCNTVPEEDIVVLVGVTTQYEVPTANGYYTKAQTDDLFQNYITVKGDTLVVNN